MTGGGVIRLIRHAMGLTQQELGELVGEGRWYIGQIERDRRPELEVSELAGLIGSRMGDLA